MKAFWAHVTMSLRLTGRDRMVLFFNYAFPLVFFFFFGAIMHADRGGTAVSVVTIVLTMGILGNGFFGAGLRAAMDREQNILRRFKVAPITPAPILLSGLVTGVISYLPAAALVLFLSHSMWGMPLPNLFNFFTFVIIALLAFRSIGLIVASSVNTMQESQILVQLLYLPMLLLSIMPMNDLPVWAQVAAQFIPAGYLQNGMQGILVKNLGLIENAPAIGALLLTMAVGTFISMKLFRWDKDEKVKPVAKLWILAVLAPFFVLGAIQTHTRQALSEAKILERRMSRSASWLIRNARIFVGDGSVIDTGAVWIKDQKIQQVFTGASPEPSSLRAESIEGNGKTVLPGLIDADIHLLSFGGFPIGTQPPKENLRALAAYLYSGVTTARSVNDPLDAILKTRALVDSGEALGAGLYTCGPVFTAPGGRGTEYFDSLPAPMRTQAALHNVRTPASPEEARRQVRELKTLGVDCISAVLDGGAAHGKRLDAKVLEAIGEEARAQSLPFLVQTGDAREVWDAVAAGANGVEHGSSRDEIPAEIFALMRDRHVFYHPTLTAVEAFDDYVAGNTEPLERPLVQQVTAPQLLRTTRQLPDSSRAQEIRAELSGLPARLPQASRNLLRAFQNGVTLVTGTNSGALFVLHGPALHRELQLWVAAGVPAAIALQAATHRAAEALNKGDHIGLIRAGYDADLIVVDGDPTKDIRQTENLSHIVLKGGRVRRESLFEQE